MIDEKRLGEMESHYLPYLKAREATTVCIDVCDLLVEVRRLNDALNHERSEAQFVIEQQDLALTKYGDVLNQILSTTSEPVTKAMVQRALGIPVNEPTDPSRTGAERTEEKGP